MERGQTSKARTCQILGVRIDLLDYQMVCDRIEDWRLTRQRHFIILATAADIRLAQTHKVKELFSRSAMNLPDGIAVLAAARLQGYRCVGRVCGPELVLRVCDWGRQYGYRHFFYGSTDNVVKRLIERLTLQFPGLIVSGFFCPPFRQLTAKEDWLAVSTINDARPDVVWVGLGGIKQIAWMAQHFGRIQAAALIGVGAAFNWHSGLARRAPAWMRRCGTEWAYRMVTEPRKIVPRTRHTLLFCLLAGLEGLYRRMFHEGRSIPHTEG